MLFARLLAGSIKKSLTRIWLKVRDNFLMLRKHTFVGRQLCSFSIHQYTWQGFPYVGRLIDWFILYFISWLIDCQLSIMKWVLVVFFFSESRWHWSHPHNPDRVGGQGYSLRGGSGIRDGFAVEKYPGKSLSRTRLGGPVYGEGRSGQTSDRRGGTADGSWEARLVVECDEWNADPHLLGAAEDLRRSVRW